MESSQMRENMPYWAEMLGLGQGGLRRDARVDARKPCFDSFRKPPGGPTRGSR